MINATPQPNYPRKRDLAPILQEAGWVAGAFWTGTENLTLLEFDARMLQPVPSGYTDYAVLAHLWQCTLGKHATFFSALFLYIM
jgi:hypothetical protein